MRKARNSVLARPNMLPSNHQRTGGPSSAVFVALANFDLHRRLYVTVFTVRTRTRDAEAGP